MLMKRPTIPGPGGVSCRRQSADGGGDAKAGVADKGAPLGDEGASNDGAGSILRRQALEPRGQKWAPTCTESTTGPRAL